MWGIREIPHLTDPLFCSEEYISLSFSLSPSLFPTTFPCHWDSESLCAPSLLQSTLKEEGKKKDKKRKKKRKKRKESKKRKNLWYFSWVSFISLCVCIPLVSQEYFLIQVTVTISLVITIILILMILIKTDVARALIMFQDLRPFCIYNKWKASTLPQFHAKPCT